MNPVLNQQVINQQVMNQQVMTNRPARPPLAGLNPQPAFPVVAGSGVLTMSDNRVWMVAATPAVKATLKVPGPQLWWTPDPWKSPAVTSAAAAAVVPVAATSKIAATAVETADGKCKPRLCRDFTKRDECCAMKAQARCPDPGCTGGRFGRTLPVVALNMARPVTLPTLLPTALPVYTGPPVKGGSCGIVQPGFNQECCARKAKDNVADEWCKKNVPVSTSAKTADTAVETADGKCKPRLCRDFTKPDVCCAMKDQARCPDIDCKGGRFARSVALNTVTLQTVLPTVIPTVIPTVLPAATTLPTTLVEPVEPVGTDTPQDTPKPMSAKQAARKKARQAAKQAAKQAARKKAKKAAKKAAAKKK